MGGIGGATLRPMQNADLEAVLALEVQCYSHPWSRGNFSDSLVSGYCARVLELGAQAVSATSVVPAAPNASAARVVRAARAAAVDRAASAAAARMKPGAVPLLLGYYVAMAGVGEWHLLNISIGPRWQGRGLGTALLAAVAAEGHARGLERLLLEVRASNGRARALYTRQGFTQDGLRRAYYPGVGQREDAVLMSRHLNPSTPAVEAPSHALG